MHVTIITLEGGGQVVVRETPAMIDSMTWGFDNSNRNVANESDRQRFIRLMPGGEGEPEDIEQADMVHVRPRSIVAMQRILVERPSPPPPIMGSMN